MKETILLPLPDPSCSTICNSILEAKPSNSHSYSTEFRRRFSGCRRFAAALSENKPPVAAAVTIGAVESNYSSFSASTSAGERGDIFFTLGINLSYEWQLAMSKMGGLLAFIHSEGQHPLKQASLEMGAGTSQAIYDGGF